jgi:hypothetical protein
VAAHGHPGNARIAQVGVSLGPARKKGRDAMKNRYSGERR